MGISMPASGKTTVLRDFAQRYGYEYVCPDDIRKELTGDARDQTRNPEVWQRARAILQAFIAEGKNVVFDATFTNKLKRMEFVEFARKVGADKIQGIFLDTPFELARKRNSERERVVPEHAMEKMGSELSESPPEIMDGFDSLFRLNEQGELQEAEMIKERKLT